jgi:hypothetical protein
MQVREIKGYESTLALQAFNTLLLGLSMLPMYAKYDYNEFYTACQDLDDENKKNILRKAAMFVRLSKDEVEALICFCLDPNGVPYRAVNLKNLKPDEIVECVVAVAFEISKFRIKLITDDEKKNLEIFQ